MKKTLLKKKRIRRMLLPALCVCLVIGMMTGTALGEESVTLKVAPGGETIAADLKNAEVQVDLYKVADTGMTALPLFETLDLTPITNNPSDDVLKDLAQKAADIVNTADPKPEAAVAGAKADGETDIEISTGSGLYLLIPHGVNGNSTVTTSDYRYTYSPVLITVPAASGSVVLKPSRTSRPGGNPPGPNPPGPSSRKGDLEIVKNLTSYEDSEPASFVFEVTAYESSTSDKVVYSNVVMLTFTEPGQKHTLVKDLPDGARVVVREYSTGHYTEAAATQEGVISASQDLKVEFTNEYDKIQKGGHGIVNDFTYSGNTWNWEQKADNAA